MSTDERPAELGGAVVTTSEADLSLDASATDKMADAKRLTEEYKEEYKTRERDLLNEVDYHYYRDNDATGAEARIDSIRTDEGNLQTTVTRSLDETMRFLSHKSSSSRERCRDREQPRSQQRIADLQALREQIDKREPTAPSVESPPKWLLDAIELDAIDETIQAMDGLFNKIDGLLSAGRFDEVNQIIEQVPLEGPSLSFLMGILTITLPATDRLTNRAKFFDRLYRLCKAMGRDAEDLLGGLRQWSGAHGAGLLGRG